MHFLRKHRPFSAQDALNAFVAILEKIASPEGTCRGLKFAVYGMPSWGPAEYWVLSRAKNGTLLAICKRSLVCFNVFCNEFSSGQCCKNTVHRRFISDDQFYSSVRGKSPSTRKWARDWHGEQSIWCFTRLSTAARLERHKGIYNQLHSYCLIVFLRM